MPDDVLLDAEAELHIVLIETDRLHDAWPRGRNSMQRARIGNRIQANSDRIRELYGVIRGTPAETPAGAAVKLRRVLAHLEDNTLEFGLVESALETVERCTA